jgi:hypothetical protein
MYSGYLASTEQTLNIEYGEACTKSGDLVNLIDF